MDFLRTLKKRRTKKHVPARVNVVPPARDRLKSRGIRIKRRGTTLNRIDRRLAEVLQEQVERRHQSASGPKKLKESESMLTAVEIVFNRGTRQFKESMAGF